LGFSNLLQISIDKLKIAAPGKAPRLAMTLTPICHWSPKDETILNPVWIFPHFANFNRQIEICRAGKSTPSRNDTDPACHCKPKGEAIFNLGMSIFME
jgi:hypothetical protein